METEDQARARIIGEVSADPSFQGLIPTDPDFISAVDIRMDAWRRGSATPAREKDTYSWLDDLPPEYIPPDRRIDVYSAGRGGSVAYQGRGLVDGRNQLARNPDGTVKNLYGAADVQSIWRGIGYPERKLISEYMKAFGVYGSSSPSLNLDQGQDFTAFARVLYTANNEGRTWDVALETLARRLQEMPKPTGRTYKPTSIADIRRTMQAQATSILGRGLTKQEVNPLARQIQGQETRQQTRASGQRPTTTSTLIEEGVQKQFAPEIQAFNFAKFAERAIGSAGSGAGVQSDPELEAVDG